MEHINNIIPKGSINRPGIIMNPEYATVHETDNWSIGADAIMHGRYLLNVKAFVSWQLTVDDKRRVQHLPLNETAYHAGDGKGQGNRNSIGLEICVNADGDYYKAIANAIETIQWVQTIYPKIKIKWNVKQHNHWSGKNCPRRLRYENKWQDFLDRVWKEGNGMKVNDKVKIKSTATKYMTGEPIPAENKGRELTIAQLGQPWNVKGSGALIEELTSWVFLTDLEPSVKVVPPSTTVPKYIYDQKIKQIENLEEEINDLQNKLRNAETTSQNRLTQINKLNAELTKRNIEKNDLMVANKKLTDSITEKNKFITELDKQLDEMEEIAQIRLDQYTKTSAAKDVLFKDYQQVSEELIEKDLDIADLKSDIATLENKAKEDRITIEKQEIEIKQLWLEDAPTTTIDWQDATWKQLLKQAITTWWNKE